AAPLAAGDRQRSQRAADEHTAGQLAAVQLGREERRTAELAGHERGAGVRGRVEPATVEDARLEGRATAGRLGQVDVAERAVGEGLARQVAGVPVLADERLADDGSSRVSHDSTTPRSRL